MAWGVDRDSQVDYDNQHSMLEIHRVATNLQCYLVHCFNNIADIGSIAMQINNDQYLALLHVAGVAIVLRGSEVLGQT